MLEKADVKQIDHVDTVLLVCVLCVVLHDDDEAKDCAFDAAFWVCQCSSDVEI